MSEDEAAGTDRTETSEELSPPELEDIAGGGKSGDAILGTLRDMESSRNALVEKIESILRGPQGSCGSVQDLMRLQFELMQLNLQIELTSKAADKSTQGVQTLFKNQP